MLMYDTLPRGKVSYMTKTTLRSGRDSLFVPTVHDSSMLHRPVLAQPDSAPLDMPGLLEVLAHNSARPRYAFMVLNLIAKAAGANGSAGPDVVQGGAVTPLRDWLCDALTPMGHREPGRIVLAHKVRQDLAAAGSLPADPDEAERLVDEETRSRIRTSSKTNISRAVSDLVRAGMIVRHYQGYRVDHHNRGAQRQAVYTLTPVARRLLKADPQPVTAPPPMRQASLPLV